MLCLLPCRVGGWVGNPSLTLPYYILRHPCPPQRGVLTATTGLYFLAYALYYSAELQLSGGVSRVLYFGYMSAAALSLGLMTGTVGLGAAYLFVVSVYAQIRVD